MHTKRRLKELGRVGKQFPRIASQRVRVKTFAFVPTSIAWQYLHANVACEMALAVISFFKLKIWKTLGKLCPPINYCQATEGTQIVENKSQVIQSLHKPYP